ncbi:Ferric reductase-like protein [Pseudoloma neurophilia]|uniref:Ferric reductase-like protein n=1 Tax=Pseudoloma neurophilia TaxID=146866 RepID=A0A0R0LVE5_9MICR|nr:Ferric reductase-like protein [Pseudoloma neurophilia]
MDEWTESGLITAIIGLFFFIFGGILLFDRTLMTGGNVLFSVGVLILLRPKLSLQNPESTRNLVVFVIGMALNFNGLLALGFILQMIAALSTIKNQLPSVRQLITRNLFKTLRFLKVFGIFTG